MNDKVPLQISSGKNVLYPCTSSFTLVVKPSTPSPLKNYHQHQHDQRFFLCHLVWCILVPRASVSFYILKWVAVGMFPTWLALHMRMSLVWTSLCLCLCLCLCLSHKCEPGLSQHQVPFPRTQHSLARAWTQATQSRGEHTNHEAAAAPHRSKKRKWDFYFVYVISQSNNMKLTLYLLVFGSNEW